MGYRVQRFETQSLVERIYITIKLWLFDSETNTYQLERDQIIKIMFDNPLKFKK